jgi:hypothetical protein
MRRLLHRENATAPGAWTCNIRPAPCEPVVQTCGRDALITTLRAGGKVSIRRKDGVVEFTATMAHGNAHNL